jgi:hypothetical protein
MSCLENRERAKARKLANFKLYVDFLIACGPEKS